MVFPASSCLRLSRLGAFRSRPGFNFNASSGSFPDIENYGGFVNFTHKIFGDQMVLFGDLFYQNTTTHNELAPGATGDFQTPGSVTLAIPPWIRT